MRIHGRLSLIVVTAWLGLAPLGAATPADAAEAGLVEAGVVEAGVALPEREVTSKIVQTERNRLVLKGNVSPGHTRSPVFIQKRNCLKDRCGWYRFDTVRTNGRGGYSARVTAPRTGDDYWRAKVKAHGGYATSYSEVWRTYTV